MVQAYTNRPLQDGPTPFKVDDLVLVSACSHELPHKFSPKWIGPYRVVHVPNRFLIVYQEGELELTTHVNHVNLYCLSGYAGPASPK